MGGMEKNALMLSIIMPAVGVDRYQSNPGKTMSDFSQSPEACKQFTGATMDFHAAALILAGGAAKPCICLANLSRFFL